MLQCPGDNYVVWVQQKDHNTRNSLYYHDAIVFPSYQPDGIGNDIR